MKNLQLDIIDEMPSLDIIFPVQSLDIIDEKLSLNTPLIFNNDVDTSNIKNLLLIDSIVSESQLFFDSSNSNTFSIIYSNNSNRADFIQLLENKFKNGLERIAFVFHDNIKDGKTFLNQELFFSENDIKENINSYSSNTYLLIDIIRKFGVKNIDFLACNSLNYQNWLNFYELLRKETGVLVGASNNNTGNLKHGGDWIMESTNQNVVNTYFNSNIENYASTLAVTITQNGGTIFIAQVGNTIVYIRNNPSSTPTIITSWPVTFVNSNPIQGNILNILIATNLTISNTTVGTGTNGYFITGSPYITYDGTGKTITIDNVSNYRGLIQNGTYSVNGYSNVTVQNINNAILGSSTIEFFQAWICQTGFGRGVSNVLINNCTNSGVINGLGVGGICGSYAGYNGGSVLITNCSNTGAVFGQWSSGICSSFAGSLEGTVSITNCSNNGVISGIAAGGICGIQGGSNCKQVSITNCYNTGAINGDLAGGITGDWFGSNTNNLCSIINCYNTGAINGTNAGGICGSNIGYNDNTKYTPNILIQNCYSLGNIASTCGGICGGTGYNIYINIPIVNIINCYTAYNIIVDSGSQYISITLQTDVRNSIISRLTNVYTTFINSWSDSNANSSLTGTPTSFNVNNPGTIWTSRGTNIYYILSSSSIITQNGGTIYIRQSGNNIEYQYNSTNGVWTTFTIYPITFINTNPVAGNVLTISLFTNITITNSTRYFNTGSSYITFDGTGKTVTINNVSNYRGLIQNGSVSSNGYSNITVKNINSAISGSSTLASSAGWICQSYFGKGANNILIDNCINSGAVNGSFSGGIGGEYLGINGTIIISNCSNSGIISVGRGGICGRFLGQSGNTSILNCSNTGNISVNFAGGICGGYLGYINGTILIINCSNTGSISASFAGGICGSQPGEERGKVSITDCRNTGAINGSSAGGITGSVTGNINGQVSITNCSNTAVINGRSSGGITGKSIGNNNGQVSITNCSNTGAINGDLAGGITGDNAGSSNGQVSITDCINTGIISGNQSGGIAGDWFGYNSNNLCSIINCYNTGNINGNYAGGITGTEVGYNNNAIYTSKILIQNCYSLGNIAATAGGICGGSVNSVYKNTPIVNITNCYTSYNSIADSGSQYISNNLPIKSSIILTNVYSSLINNWSDTNASSALSGALSIYRNSKLYKYYSNFGSVWYSNQNNSPFSFTSDLETAPRRQQRK